MDVCPDKKNPLQFHFQLPTEYLDPNRAADEVPQRLAIFWLEPADLGYDPEVIKAFNKRPEEYLESKGTGFSTRIKKSYVQAIHRIQDRISKVLAHNLKVVLWIQLVKLYNKNLVFRKFMIGDKPLHKTNGDLSFANWDAIGCANDALRFGLKASLPIPSPKPRDFDDLSETVKMFERLEYSRQMQDFEVQYSRWHCLQEAFEETNSCFEMYEEIIDLIREVFDQPKRDDGYARLLNPIAQW